MVTLSPPAVAARGEIAPNPEPTPAHRRPPLPALTGLRFLAALYVVFYHFGPYPQLHLLSGPVRALQIALWNTGGSGFVGVNLFFLLSGFILAYTYLGDAHARGRWRAFYVARVARVYPVYVFALAVAIAVRCLNHATLTLADAPGLLSTLTLTQGWRVVNVVAWNPPAWSLSVEAVFYLSFPFLAVLIARLRARLLVPLLGALWALTMLAPLVWLLRTGTPAAPFLTNHPLVRLPEFLIGVIVGLIFMRSPRPSRHIARVPAVTLCAIVAVLAMLPVSLYPFLQVGLLDPLFAILIYSLAFSRGRLAAILSAPLMVLLGEASYALYMLQGPGYEWLTSLLHVSPIGTRYSLAFFLDYLVIIVIVAVLTLRLVEQPARRAIRHRYRLVMAR